MFHEYKLKHATLHYEDESHCYKVDGKIVPSVTGLNKLLPKAFHLERWLIDTPMDKYSELIELHLEKGKQISSLDLRKFKKLAKSENDRIKETAGDIGTDVHELYQKWKLGKPFIEPKDEVIKPMFDKLKKFDKDLGIKPLFIEKKIYSKKYNYAGTLDLICTTKKSKELTLIDWKTSKAIYDNYIYQTLAYKFAFEEETGDKIKSMKIIRVPKGEEKIEIKDVKWNQTHFDTFLGLVHQWNSNELLKKEDKLITTYPKEKKNDATKK